ncbi:hypothetical protein DB354_21780 [Opitutus sp. ER46]|nr:hypothetical protein DB354_21780 [Opitutus sp. ER46]
MGGREGAGRGGFGLTGLALAACLLWAPLLRERGLVVAGERRSRGIADLKTLAHRACIDDGVAELRRSRETACRAASFPA